MASVARRQDGGDPSHQHRGGRPTFHPIHFEEGTQPMSLDTHSPLPTPRGGPVSTPSDRTAPVRSTTAHVAFLALAVAVALIGMVGIEVIHPDMADSSTPRLIQGVLILVALAAWTGMVAEIVMEAIRDEKADRS